MGSRSRSLSIRAKPHFARLSLGRAGGQVVRNGIPCRTRHGVRDLLFRQRCSSRSSGAEDAFPGQPR